MKQIKNKFPVSLLILALAGLLLGCMQPLGQETREGDASIVILDGVAKTIQPSDAEIKIASYTVSGVGPDGATLSKKSFTTSPHSESKLNEGSWTFTVEGLNAAGSVVASGSSIATIIANDTVSVSVVLTPVKDGSGVGTFSLSGTIPSTVTLSSFTGVIAPSTGGASTNFTVTVSGTSFTYSNNTLPVGSYILTLVASQAAGTWRNVYALRIYQGKTSSLSLTLTADDFAEVDPTLLIDPASVTNGTKNTTYTFTLTAGSLPANLSTINFNWNFGDGTTDKKSVSITNKSATTSISHAYTADSAYGLVVTIDDSTNTLATAYASVLIGTANAGTDYDLTVLDTWTAANSGGYGITVDTWDISKLPNGCVFDLKFDAYSMPDKYIVEYPDGTIVYNSGWRGDASYEGNAAYPGGISGIGAGEKLAMFAKGSQQHFKITIIGGESGTAWEYSIKARNP